jgi:hypothetical protein
VKETDLWRALVGLYRAGEIKPHVLGEIQSLWDARETVRRFVNGESIECADETSDMRKAAGPLISHRMITHLTDRPDNTPVRIEVVGRCGFVKHFTLGDYRRFVEVNSGTDEDD